MTTQQIISAIPLAYLSLGFIPLVILNFRQNRVPNKFLMPVFLITLITNTTTAIMFGTWVNWGVSILSSVLLLIGLVIWHHRSGQIGMGDIKLIVFGLFMISSVSLMYSLIYLGSVILGFVLLGLALFFFSKKRETIVRVAPMLLAIIISIGSLAVFA